MDVSVVDVAIVTYNHAAFVRQTIDSVLGQKTSFPFRILVGDDCSQDGTQDILREYEQRYPGRFLLMLDDIHHGLDDNNRVGVRLLRACSAKYIALLDGDDYWIDTNKLQLQVDFLEQHPECSICTTNAKIYYQSDPAATRLYHVDEPKTYYLTEDLMNGNLFLTSSALIKGSVIQNLPPWFIEMPVGDYPIYIYGSTLGNIAYLHEVTAVYRVHANGAWQSYSNIQAVAKSISVVNSIRPHLEPKYGRMMFGYLARLYLKLAGFEYNEKDYRAAVLHSFQGVRYSFFRPKYFFPGIKLLFRSLFPWI